MAVISHCGVDYTAPTVEVQSDASATSLEPTKVPTGQTITSYLNSNFLDIKRVTAGTNVTVNSGGYYKLGNLVIVNIRLTISSGASNTNIVYGLPTYSGENRVSVQNNKNLDLSITPEGKLQYSSTSVPTGTLIITASYVVNI